MKKTILSIALVLAALVGFTACEKEQNNTGKDVIEGLPVNSIKLNLSAPSDDVIAVTRASAEVETNVQNMALFFYKAGTNDKPIIVYVDKNGMGTPTATTSTNYKYTVNLDVTDKGITTGNWYLYAIANYNTKFCNVDMTKIAELTRTEFLAYNVNKANRELDIVENSILMTGNYCENGTFGEDGSLTLEYDNKEEESCTMNGVIHLRRIVAKISFEFKSGENTTTTGVTFTPETYSIHEYARSSTLMERPYDGWTTTNGVTYNNGEYAGTGDFHSHADGVALAVVDNKLEFYMPENIQKAKADPTTWTYAERERRENATDRTFKYAPEHGTYIVVKGQYKDSKYSGNVTYTIHLGDFSAKNGNAYENFSIRRNFHYTYTVTVNGVNSIVVEAQTDEENQSGAEGNLIGYNSESFNVRLDAHYENVLLKIAAPSGSTVNEYSVMLNTPYSKNVLITSNDLSGKANADYDWIRFGKPASATEFKAYKESETTDIFTLLNEIKGSSLTSDGEHYIVRNGYIYTTAYVNEYYYESKMNSASDKSAELKKFINADDRTMTIAFGTIEVSSDKQSSYTDNVVFSIQQRSIKSFYNLNVDNPFGVEQIDETDKNKSSSISSTSTERLNGYKNFKATVLPSSSKVMWSRYLNITDWGYQMNDNTPTFTSSQALTTNGKDAAFQCLSRNRDENGDGYIDDTELKWYLPAVDQCGIYWFGMSSLPSEARISMNVSSSNTNNYWTSTYNLEIWWADEGSAYGKKASLPSDEKYYPAVRCVRSLKTIDGAISDVSIVKDDIITISGLDNKSVRETGTVNGEYSEHFRGEAMDILPEAFKVAKADLSCKTTATTTKSTFTNSEIQTGNWCQQYYAEMADSTDVGSWRIPNEKELSLMLKYSENLTTAISDYTSAKSKYARSSTLNMIYFVQTGTPRFITTTEEKQYASDFVIRCVRDATPDTSGADETDKSSNTFESGGNVIK